MTLSFDHTVRLHDPEYRGFASDNYAGIHPEVLTAIAAANKGHQIAYGWLGLVGVVLVGVAAISVALWAAQR